MKLPTRYLPAKIRSAVRFFFVGTTGAVLQTWFFMAALTVMGEPDKGTALYYVAFGIGYILEMIPNYFFSNWYTFNTRPSKKNAGAMIKAAAKQIQGGGGGQPWMATAGGRDVNGLNAAMEELLAALQ